MDTAVSVRSVENEHVRVTLWRFPPGTATGWHRHEYDYVITPIAGGPFRIVDAEGNETAVRMEAGQSYFRSAGVEHDVISAGEAEQSFVEVELISRPG